MWRADRRGTLAAAAYQVLGACAALGLVLASKLALSAVLDDDEPASALVVPLVLLALTTAVSGAVGSLQGLQQRLLGERVSQWIWRDLLRSAAGVELVEYESTAFLSRLERVRTNAVGRPLTVVTSLLGLGGSLISVLALSGALIAIEPLLVPLLLLGGVPAVLISRRASRAEYAFSRTTTRLGQRRGYLKLLVSHRQAAAELRAFDAAPELLRRHAADDQEYLGRLERHVQSRRRLVLAGLVGSAATLSLALVAIIALASSGRMSLPEAGAAAIAARLLAGQLSSAFRTGGTLIEAAPFLRDLEDFARDHPPRTESGSRRRLQRGVEATALRFTYPGQQRTAVQDVSLAVPRGQVIALVGENGSGKTTLAKLLAGLYRPESGRVLWDGEQLPTDDLRASCSVLFQDYLRYQMTVGENVTISDTGRELEPGRVRRSLEQVGIAAAVDRLDHGVDTVMGIELAEGSDLSGGQWQRVALARALYRDTDLVVLDEPSAALDPRAEHELFRDVRGVLGGRSAVLISHRYSSVRLADHIYVLHEGRVVESGTHEELVEAGGRYAELYDLQAEAYLS
ncbi:ABC transporter [Modestobacter italicus]|uniref:ABC transporter n=1 Tax=Modestobacter italicus (strain DSM 44449 / CECT 9708 / BC 501) TaxID=2732864 RepID=I4ERB5_MODI5|nr:ABC transporter ATP-binding protein [Modestobacter marinus]CCH85928.1 ABC transporter [Modestobacter marinus]